MSYINTLNKQFEEDAVGQRVKRGPEANEYCDQHCQVRVWRNWHYYQCSNKRKHEVNGIWYCGTHVPSAVERRRAKQEARWAEKDRKWDRVKRQKELRDKALEALVEIAKGEMNDPAGYAAMILEDYEDVLTARP